MHYLFASNATPDKLPIGFSLVAGARMLSLEEPWASGAPLLARVATVRRGSMRSNR
jgi:hypothetical protein